MRAALLAALLLWQTAAVNEPPVAKPQYMRYVRAMHVPRGNGQACAVLDAAIFPHAAPSLTDLRIFPSAAGAHEVPHAITMSEAITQETQSARVLNLGSSAGRIAFDLQMPQRAYTSVALDLDPLLHDFLATATVTGGHSPAEAAKGAELGVFTLFDLASQHLSRDTTLPLQESTFPYLHVVLSAVSAAGARDGQSRFTPSMVQGAEVPPSREAQIVYTTVAETQSVLTAGRESFASFAVPARVPVERVEFVLAPGYKGNFSRDVKLTATTEPAPQGSPEGGTIAGGIEDDARASLPEVVNGSILRVHTAEAGREIRTDNLGFAAILGSNLQHAAKVQVAIENGDDQPLPIAVVKLEMRQRKLCFDAAAAAGAPLSLYYGDPALVAPVYDYARLFVASANPLAVTLGPEQGNPRYTPRPQAPESFTDRHPQVLWIALIITVCILGAVALRAAKNVGR